MAIEPGSERRAHQWHEEQYSRERERDVPFETLSGHPIAPLYTSEDLAGHDAERDEGFPGSFPYTRGVYPSMYRGRLWTMRQFAGFGTVEETNERFRYLLEHGQTGLSTAFDMPTLMGLDSDHERSLGEVGVEGVALDTVDDMETLFDGIPLDEVTVSMTINAPAAILLAFYVVAAEEKGIPPEQLGGTIQTDILKEYIAQKEWCFPIEPAMRLVTDMVEWCSQEMPRWHPISISGYHIREAGATARAGARLHPQGRAHLRRARRRAGPRRRRVRAAAVVLLQRPHRLLRGDRQVPRRSPDLGPRAPRQLRRQGPEVDADAHPRPDGGRQPDRPAAARQHRQDDDRGARRGPRRHPVAAHQQLRRSARAADRRGGPDRPPHPAGDRPRVRASRTRSTRSGAPTSSRS